MINNQLIPEKHRQQDLFLCDVSDAVLKDIIPQMEHPFFSLSKKPDTKIRRYEHNGNWLEVTPSIKGLATIYDKDILIFAISQLMAKINAGEKPCKRIRITAYDILVFTNRGTSGKDYDALCDALDRLKGTQIKTNIVFGDEEQTDFIGLIDGASVRRKNGIDGRLQWVELQLSDWVYAAIEAKKVLTLNRDYFRLRKPTERRIYEIVRKHCGIQPKWSVGLNLLHKKTGSQGTLRRFRQGIKDIVEHNHLPDYTLKYDEDTGLVTFRNRQKWWNDKKHSDGSLPPLPTSAFEDAKEIAPNYDVYYLEQEFRAWWMNSEKPQPQNLKGAFLGFCKTKHNERPQP